MRQRQVRVLWLGLMLCCLHVCSTCSCMHIHVLSHLSAPIWQFRRGRVAGCSGSPPKVQLFRQSLVTSTDERGVAKGQPRCTSTPLCVD